MLVPADKLRSVLGVTDVTFTRNDSPLAITDKSLAE
jgi:hypothetical protein